VAVRASPPTGATNQGTDRILHGPVIGLGCIENISFGFQDIGGIGKVPVQGTAPVTLQCGSWFTAAGRSNLRLAITDDKTSRGGVQDATTWFPVIVEAITNSTDANLGFALQQLWELTAQVDVPDTLMAGAADGGSSFGRNVPVVYDVNRADRYAPTRRKAMLPVRGQGFLNLPVIQPESDLWQWLGAVFVPDANMIELFPSLEFPQLTTIGPKDKQRVNTSTSIVDVMNPDPQEVDMPSGMHLGSSPTQAKDTARGGELAGPNPATVNRLGQALHGAQPVLVYRLKPFLMHPINAANWGRPTVSERLKVNQQAVDPSHHGVAQVWYSVAADETLNLQVSYSEKDRVNLTFARPTMVQTGALRPYTQFGKVVMPDQADFNRYGLRAYEPMWPFIPEGSAVTPGQARAQTALATGGVQGIGAAAFGAGGSNGLIEDFEALNELVWSLCGEAEKFAHATLTTRARPWCRAGHWMDGRIGGDGGDGSSTMQHWTGYIESVEHFFTVDEQARWHSSSTFNLSRVSFDRKGRKFFTPADNPKAPVAGRKDEAPKKKKKPEKVKQSPPQKSSTGNTYGAHKQIAAKLLQGPRPTNFHDKHYPPGSSKQIALFEAAAAAVGLPKAWAKDKDLQYILGKESDGWVGLPNGKWVGWYKNNGYPQMTFATMKGNPDLWPLVWKVIQDGNAVPSKTHISSHATGLAQMQTSGIYSYYPDSFMGIGDPFNEAVGFLLYMKRMRGGPASARAFWDAHNWW
jgi:hypothetical protein